MDLDVTVEPSPILSARLEALLQSAIALLPNLFAAVVILALTALLAWAAGALARRAFERTRARPALAEAMHRLAQVGAWAAGLVVAATLLFPDLTPANALAGLGLGSLLVGLAFRDIFENFLAGLLVLLRRPMRIGDDVVCENMVGRVERISLRETHLRKRSGELVVVPNTVLFKHPVEILTDQTLRRITTGVGIAFGEDVDEAREVIRGAVERMPSVADRPVDVFATGFGSSSIDFLVRWWTGSTPPDEYRSRDEVVGAIKHALDEAGIEIPFPYRTLTFHEPL
ncbi:MAG: mechanosensitive ion channel family protein, partial [Guyparkeria sp.]